MPLLFINNQYYEQFLHFLNFYDKYIKFKKYDHIFIKYFLIPYEKDKIASDKKFYYLHKHNYLIFAEVIENINYYKQINVCQIINEIKKENTDYKNLINKWIVIMFEVMSDYILFVLKKIASYYICPGCKNPLLFINENKEKLNLNKINYNDKGEDPFLYKSMKISNKLLDIIIENADENFLINYKMPNFEKKKFYSIANPIKENAYINLIYFNDNYENNLFEHIEEIDHFEKKTNGLFIFSHSLESFINILEMISKKNENNCKFYLISNERNFEIVMDCIHNFKFIQKVCIYCHENERYKRYLNEYQDILEGIYTSEEEVIQFIENNSLKRTKVYKSLKIITYDNYKKIYYKIHNAISEYYRDIPTNSFTTFNQFFKELKEEIKNDNNSIASQFNDNEVIEIFEKFKIYNNSQNAAELIKDYTGDILYKIINNWLLNIGKWSLETKKNNNNWFQRIINYFFRKKESLFNKKNAYFVGQLMYRLNFKIIEQKNINNQEYNESEITLYRGLKVDYLEALSYPIQLGKIISFATFLSTSKNREVAEDFACESKIKEKRDNYELSIIMKINVKQNNHLFPLYYRILESDSNYKGEEERLFHPFTFFKLINYNIDYSHNNLELELDAIGKRDILELVLNENNQLVYDLTKNIMIGQNGEYYEGNWLNGNKNGNGIIFYSNNEIKYFGNFVNGKYEGNGKYKWKDGEYYIGNFVNGFRHGKGKQYYNDNKLKYDGNFVNGKYEGDGTYYWENGEYYIGNFVNWLRHGKGKQYYSNNKIKYDDNFINDKYEGNGKYKWENGEYYIGNFVNGLRHGRGKQYYSNNKIKYDGNFVDDEFKPNGFFSYLYSWFQ